MKGLNLLRLNGYLPEGMEREYRLYYLKDDVRTATISMLFLTILLVIFAYNDYALFGFTPTFYYLVALRSIYLVYYIGLIIFLRNNRSPVKFDWNLLVWLILSAVMMTAVNVTIPSGYIGNVPIDIVIILIIYLGMPMRFIFRTTGGLLFMLAESLNLVVLHHAALGAALYTSIVALLMANVIGIYVSGRLYSFRRSEFKARAEKSRALDLLNETGKMASVGGWEFDVKTRLQTWTDEVYRIYELEAGRHMTVEDGIKYYAPEAVPVITEAIQHAVIFGEPFDLELPFITARGNHRWIRSVGKAYSENGLITRVGGTVQDITAAKKAEDIIKGKSEQWQATFDAISDLVSIQDKDFKVIRVNKDYADAFQVRPEELLGKHCYEVVHMSSSPIPNCPHERAIKCKSGATEEVFEPLLGMHMEVSCSPIFNEQGEVEGTVHIVKDITERKKIEEERQKAAERIQDLYNNAPAGYHSLDKDGTFVRVNDTELAWLGYERDELIGKKKFSELMTAESQEIFQREFLAFKQRGWVKDLEFDLVRKDGTTFSTLLNATVIEDEAGNFLMSRTTLFDITEVKRLQKIVAESEKRFRTMLEEINDSYFELDLARNLTFVNRTLCNVLGYSKEELIGMDPRPLIAVEDRKMMQEQFHQVFLTGEPHKGLIFRLIRKDGVLEFAEISISPQKDDHANVIGFRCVGRNVTERMELQNKLAVLAMHDALTGLPNRSLLYDRFNIACAQAQRNNRKLAVMGLDLDRFKTINDTLGHAAGDGLLKATADRLSAMVRKSDTVARLGGDEFVVLIPELTNIKDVLKTAQKIVSAFQKPFVIDGHEIQVTTSIGIAVYPRDGSNIEELLKAADTAMYYTKEHGRNSYRLSGDKTRA